MSRLRFGTFLAPFHAPGVNPTAALRRDLRLIEHLDELGFDPAPDTVESVETALGVAPAPAS